MHFEVLSADNSTPGARLGVLSRSSGAATDGTGTPETSSIVTPTWVLPTVRGSTPGIANTLLERYCLRVAGAGAHATCGRVPVSTGSNEAAQEYDDHSQSSFCVGVSALDFWNYKGTEEPDGAKFLELNTEKDARHLCSWQAFPGPLVLSMRSALALFDMLEKDGHPQVVQFQNRSTRKRLPANEAHRIVAEGLFGDTRGSRMPVTPERILDLQQAMRCDLYETLYEVSSWPQPDSSDPADRDRRDLLEATGYALDAGANAHPRIGTVDTLPAERTKQWGTHTLRCAAIRNTPGLALLSVPISRSEEFDRGTSRWALELANAYRDRVAGFNLVGLGTGGAPMLDVLRQCLNMVQHLRSATSKNLPVFCTGGSAWLVDGSPAIVLGLVASGVDVLESRYPFVMAECCYALDLFHESQAADSEASDPLLYTSVRDPRWAHDARPILQTCRSAASARRCTIGRTYTRAYWYHLFQVNEMLGPMLLSLHNIQQYLAFFDEIQDAIRAHTFASLCERFQVPV
jgi:queuine/archaeosine tRNA-ribosyltransferase